MHTYRDLLKDYMQPLAYLRVLLLVLASPTQATITT